MGTLFKIQSTLVSDFDSQLSSEWQQSHSVCQRDAIILLGQSLALADAYLNELCLDEQCSDGQCSDDQCFTPQIYALQADFSNLNRKAKETLLQSSVYSIIELIDDEQWVVLTESFDKVVTISD